MKLAMIDWWGSRQRLLGILEKARAEGIDVTGDVYRMKLAGQPDRLFPNRDFTSRESAQFALDHVSRRMESRRDQPRAEPRSPYTRRGCQAQGHRSRSRR